MAAVSTDWGYRCTGDGAHSGCSLNHGQGVLRELAKAGPALKLLGESGVDVDVSYWMDGAPVGFLYAHGDHLLELISEYGDIEPLDKACGEPHGALPDLVCERSAGHASWASHEGTWTVETKQGNVRYIQHTSRVRWDRPVPDANAAP